MGAAPPEYWEKRTTHYATACMDTFIFRRAEDKTVSEAVPATWNGELHVHDEAHVLNAHRDR
jgi:hypothetical protein